MSDNGRKRLRVVSFTVQPLVMEDDGENLLPLPVTAVQIPAAEWNETAVEKVAEAVARLRAEIES